jgi:hypothetical protein
MLHSVLLSGVVELKVNYFCLLFLEIMGWNGDVVVSVVHLCMYTRNMPEK